MFDLPAAGTFGKDRVAGTRIAVLGETRRCDVDQNFSAPDPHVRQVKVPERDGGRAFIADEPDECFFVGVGPEMFVVVRRISVHDQQLIVVVTDANRERQIGQPREPLLA